MPDKIPLVDLVAQYRRYKDELDSAIHDILDRGAFIGGQPLASFEAAYADFCGTRHAVGVGNGTDALHLALRGLGVGPGDEVLVPANTFIATSEAVTMCGARPVFVDVDEATALIDLEAAQAAVTDKTTAMLPVHLYGQLCDMSQVAAFAEKNGLLVVEDAAQAHGAERDGKRAGSFARAGCFSFYPGKNLGAYGDAGAMVTDDSELADKVRRLANHGRSQKYGHDMEGVNSRLDGIQSAVLSVKLRHLTTATTERQEAALRYDALLEGVEGVTLPSVVERPGHVFHLYVIRVADRDGLKKHLAEHNIFAGVHYPLPLHLQPAYAQHGYREGQFPATEKLAGEILSLPMFPELTADQQGRVAAQVRAFLGQ